MLLNITCIINGYNLWNRNIADYLSYTCFITTKLNLKTTCAYEYLLFGVDGHKYI